MSLSVRALLVLGCVAGVVAGAAPLELRSFGWPTNVVLAGVSACLLLGATALRISADRELAAAERAPGGGSTAVAAAAVASVASEVRELRDRADALDAASLASEIDALVAKRVYPVLEAQPALVASQGFARYASHTSPWAAGERMLYRAWSAATDGHASEALASLDEAIPHFEEAARRW